MVRPPFPPIFRESQMPDVNTISEPIVVVNNAWKVGDLVDWWKDDCYWSGSITEITEDDKFQVISAMLHNRCIYNVLRQLELGLVLFSNCSEFV